MSRFENLNQAQKAQLEDLKNKNSAKQAQEKYLARPEGAPENTAPERDPETLQAWAEDLKNRTESGEKRKDNDLDTSGESAEEPRTMVDLAEDDKKLPKQEEVKEDILDVLGEQQGKSKDKNKQDKPEQEDVMEVLRGQLEGNGEQESKVDAVEKETKSKEQIVNETRKEYAKALVEFEAYKKPTEVSKKAEERVEDENKLKEYESKLIETRNKYFQAVGDWRKELFNQIKQDMDGMSRKELNKELKGVINETLAKEAIKVMELKQELNREMVVDKQRNWLGDKAKQIGNWYMKRPWYEKVAVGLGIYGGAALAVSVGGVAGMAIGGGVAAVGVTRRTLASLSGYFGASMTTEHGAKKVQEWSNKREVNKKFSDALLNAFETKSQELDKQLETFNFNRVFKTLINKSQEQQKSRNILKKTVGGILGASIFLLPSVVHAFEHGDAANGVRGGKVPRYPFGTAETGKVAQASEVAPAAEAPTSGAGHIGLEEAPTTETPAPKVGPKLPWETDLPKDFNPVYDTPSKGNVWNGLKEKMGARYGEAFTKLEPGKQNYIIDKLIKSEIIGHEKDFKLVNVNKIGIGQDINFSPIFDNKEGIAKAFQEAEKLSPSTEKYHKILHDVKHGAGFVEHETGEGDIRLVEGAATLYPEAPPSPPPNFRPFGEYGSVNVDGSIQEQINAQEAAVAAAEEGFTIQSAEFGPVWDKVMHGQVPLSNEELVSIKKWSVGSLLNGERPTRPASFFRRTFNSDWNRAWTRLAELAKIQIEGMSSEDIEEMTVEQLVRRAAKA